MTDPHQEGPPHAERLIRRVKTLEWITVAHILTTAVFMYMTMGSSQAMKTAFLDDLIGLVPTFGYLIALRFNDRPPSLRFPYGYHRAMSIAFISAGVSILALGIFLAGDSALKLISFEHPTVGTGYFFGHSIWMGYLMLGALIYNAIPRAWIGRAKLPLAKELNDKVLYAEAAMNRADWLNAAAAAVGVIGIGFGLWWADPAIALVISIEIIEEGWKHSRGATHHLMNELPTSVEDYDEFDPLPDRLEDELRTLDWVRDARVRLREEGRLYFGEAFIVAGDGAVTPEQLQSAEERLLKVDWRVGDIVITVVDELEKTPQLKGLQ